MFHSIDSFPFTTEFERNWKEIHREFLGVRGQMMEYVERDLHDNGWKVFIMANFPHREPIYGNDVQCPVTMSLLRRHVPRPGVVCFSLLEPFREIHPHEGYKGEYLRCHLGLEVPSGDCGLQIGEEIRRWEEGKTLVFDDRSRHSAWNRTSSARVVMLFDFIP